MGEHQKAISFYEKSIQINSNYVNAYNNLGTILLELGNVNEAKKNFEKSLNLNQNNKETCEGYGNVLLKLDKHDKALAYIQKGTGFIRFTPKDFNLI